MHKLKHLLVCEWLAKRENRECFLLLEFPVTRYMSPYSSMALYMAKFWRGKILVNESVCQILT